MRLMQFPFLFGTAAAISSVQVREEQSLVQSVDWVVEGLLLPVVCGVGVLGETEMIQLKLSIN